MKKKLIAEIGIFILYIIIIFIFSIAQNFYSDPGFIFRDFRGQHIQNFIISLAFIIFCLFTGIILRILNRKILIYCISGFWLFILLSFIIINICKSSLPIIFGIVYIIIYPIMCGVAFIGIVDSYENLKISTYVVFSVIIPCVTIYIGYILANVMNNRRKEEKKLT